MVITTVSTNFVGATKTSTKSGFKWMEAEAEDKPRVTERKIEEITMLENLMAATQKKIDSTQQRMGSQQQNTGPVTRSKKEAKKETQNANRPLDQPRPNSDSQFKYSMPIEDPSLVGKVAKKALDNAVTISTRELLFISPIHPSAFELMLNHIFDYERNFAQQLQQYYRQQW